MFYDPFLALTAPALACTIAAGLLFSLSGVACAVASGTCSPFPVFQVESPPSRQAVTFALVLSTSAVVLALSGLRLASTLADDASAFIQAAQPYTDCLTGDVSPYEVLLSVSPIRAAAGGLTGPTFAAIAQFVLLC